MTRLAAARLGLLHARRRAARVERGIDLLRKKREALVAELMRLARPAIEARRRLGDEAAAAHRALLGALAAHGADGLRALGWPARELAVEVDVHRVWGVAVAHLGAAPPVRRTIAARGLSPASTGPAALAAAAANENVVELLLDAAAREVVLRGLGEALARTTRQLYTLEERVLPPLQDQIADVARVLDEREREDQQRLRRFRGRGARS